MILSTLACVLLLLLLAGQPAPASHAEPQAEADRQLAEEIFKIKAIDHHAHPLRATREGEEDKEYDALPPDALEPPPLPARLSPANPEYVGAWRDLWGYHHGDMTQDHVRDVLDARAKVARAEGDGYPAWVL